MGKRVLPLAGLDAIGVQFDRGLRNEFLTRSFQMESTSDEPASIGLFAFLALAMKWRQCAGELSGKLPKLRILDRKCLSECYPQFAKRAKDMCH